LLFLNIHPNDLTDPNLLSPDAPHMEFADRIVLEVTERSALDRVDKARRQVAALREAGFRIAVDDLGAGYAGLGSFIQLDPDMVKLDMALVRDVDSSSEKQHLVRSVTQVCGDLGLSVVGEGVETGAERDALVELGCDLLQGHLFGRPAATPACVDW
jgi:EAL domain-containing protein (putative c-di-GMP-specific phosphodiesterase class I)